MKRRSLPLVDRLRVRTPCDVGWDNMDERGRDRHCARCDLTVHDVASMTRAEVDELLAARERGERVCLHLHVRRSDGAVLVADGHLTRARDWRSPSRALAAAAATMTAMTAACSSTSAPPEAPLAVIAVGSATAPSVIETSPPPIESPAPIESHPPLEALPMTPPTMPAPEKPAKKIAASAPKAAKPATKSPSKKRYVILDGDAW